ncbi:hypothetical protein [Nocardioides massiliensis]|uniref:DUF2157 domain-containing protein n=1 Tax=Nocardioides massiliensis TaxID=1325935 RepID=A0ABT9NLV0_9ACTN|nr:hypothetical protein [Nocardioides massiliensis]MDP9821397.1 hypothetical protein [Nocardioides massiliensis]
MTRTPTARPDPAEAHRATSPRSRAVVDALIRADLLDPVRRGAAADVVSEVLDGSARREDDRRWLPELAGYVGGAFVVGAVLLFFLQTWDELSVTAQIILLGVAAAVLAVGGVLVRGRARAPHATGAHGVDDVRRRLSATLCAGAALSAAGAVGLLVDELDGADWGDWPGAAFALTLLALGVLGYLWAPSVLGQLVIVWGVVQSSAMLLFGTIIELEGVAESLAFAAVMLLAGVSWLVLAERRVWRERLAGRVVGCGLVALGAQWPIFGVANELGYLLSLLAAAAAFGAYVRLRAWPYLVLGVGLVTVVVPEILLDWTDGTLGVAGVLLVGGLILLTGSVLGLRVHRDAHADD